MLWIIQQSFAAYLFSPPLGSSPVLIAVRYALACVFFFSVLAAMQPPGRLLQVRGRCNQWQNPNKIPCTFTALCHKNYLQAFPPTPESLSQVISPRHSKVHLNLHRWTLFSQTLLSNIIILAGVVALAPGNLHTMLVLQDGSVWSTGVGAKSDRRSRTFVRVISGGATAAAAGNHYSIVLKQDGSVWVRGRNHHGQLGDGKRASRADFAVVKMIPGGKAVTACGDHSMVLTQEGDVWATGWNKYGQLGDGLASFTTRYILISNGAKAVAAGDLHSIVLKEDGSVWATGRNNYGQLGDGSKVDRSSFVQVVLSGAVAVAAGGSHSMVLKQGGSVWTTGWNHYGQLGDGSATDRVNYIEVVSSLAKSIAAGGSHSMVLKQDGSVWAAGNNLCGQLGDGTSTNSEIFVQVISDGAKVIAGGVLYSMVLKQDGAIWATGSNRHGQFGDGSKMLRTAYGRIALLGNGAGYATTIHMACFHLRAIILFDYHNALHREV